MFKIKTKKQPKINNRLRHYRKLRGFSQREVAKILKIHHTEVSKWESGIIYPNLINALKLSILYRRFLLTLFEVIYWELYREIREREVKCGYK